MIIGGILGLWAVCLGIIFFHPFFYGPPLDKSADLISKNIQPEEAIVHTSPMTFYSFLYFHQSTYPEYLTIAAENIPSIFKIGGYQKKNEAILPQSSGVWLVNTRDWVPTEAVEKTERALETNFIFDQKTDYGNIQLSHYIQKQNESN